MKKNIFPFSNGAVASSLLLALLSPLAGAAGLNEITVFSALGQPLRAEIVVTATANEIPGMEARLASPEVFAINGMNYATSLRQLRISLERRGNDVVIKITSDGPISDPIMSFMLDLTWPDGRLTKGYTFLLDPVVEGRGAPVSTMPDSAARYSRATPSVQVAVQAAQQEASATRRGGREVSTPSARPDAKADSKAEDGGAVGHTVRSGETLHSIARSNLSGGLTLEQMVVALYRNNVVAFANGDANRLLTGSILRIPSVAEASQLSPEEARKVYRSTFTVARPAAPRPAIDAGQTAISAEDRKREREMTAREREIKKNDERAAKLERDAERLKQEVAARDKRIAAEKAKLDEERQKAAQSAADAEAAKKAEADRLAAEAAKKAEADRLAAEAAKKAEADRLAAEAEKAEADRLAAEAAKKAEADRLTAEKAAAEAELQAAEAELKAEADRLAELARQQAEIKSIEESDMLMKLGAEDDPGIEDGFEGQEEQPLVAEPPQVVEQPQPLVVTPPAPPSPALDSSEFEEEGMGVLPLLGGVLFLALLGGGWFYMRRKKARDEEDDADLDSETSERFVSGLSGFTDDGLNSIFQVTTGQNVKTATATTPPSELSQALPDSFGMDEVDPVMEADVYMSYARDAQAEELLLDALPKDPNRVAIRVKLLEIYANRKSAVEFEVIAREVYAQTGGKGADWEKVVAMGSVLDPGNQLYGGKGFYATDVGTSSIAFAIRTDTGAMSPEQTGALPLEQSDSGLSGVSNDDPLLQMLREGTATKPATDSDLDFDLAAMEQAEESLPESVATMVVSKPTGAKSELDFALDEEPEVEEKPIVISEPPAPKPVPEAAMDDSSSTWVSDADPAAAATVVNPDFAFTKTLTRAEEIEGMNVPGLDLEAELMPEDMEMAATTFMPLGGEQEEDVEFDVQLTESTILGHTGSLDELSGIDLDLKGSLPVKDIQDEMDASAEAILGSAEAMIDEVETPLDDVKTMIGGLEAPFGDAETLVDDSVIPIDTDSPDARRGENDTKLELAKVYEEMGDLEGARELLAEVITEGDQDQIRQAEAILARLSG
ncbi:MAG: hypothetical protein FWH15_08820 [Betaproteobacteria bacterium]|nr:hypothetical protein [Betaproteobacteria bacterium]